MKLSTVVISNHSRIADCTIEVRDNLILVGPNGSGKSSVIRCLDMLLGKSVQQLYYSVNESDFRDKSIPFSIEATLTDLTNDELSFFPDEFDTLSESLTVRFEATLDDTDLSISRYCPMGLSGSSLGSRQLNIIGWKTIPSDFSSKNLSSGKKTIVDEYLKVIDAEGTDNDLSDAVASLCRAIEESPTFNDALSSLVMQLDSTLDGGIDEDKLRFIPGAAIGGNLLSDVRLQIEGESGAMREVTEQSDGTKALISFSILALINDGSFLAIDEPETHLHPSAQRNLTKILKKMGKQLIIATHSGVVAGEFDPDNIVVTHGEDGVVQPEQNFLQNDQKTLARWWISSRIELLTAKHIIAVEGQSDRMILAKVVELTNRQLERDGTEILEAGSCNEMKHVISIFGKNGFGLRISILVDEDAEDEIATLLSVSKGDLLSHSIHISRRDLEDEYVSAIGAEHLWDAISKSSLFTRNQLKKCSISSASGIPNEAEVAGFCRGRKHKTTCAVVACDSLDLISAPRISSIVEVLNDTVL